MEALTCNFLTENMPIPLDNNKLLWLDPPRQIQQVQGHVQAAGTQGTLNSCLCCNGAVQDLGSCRPMPPREFANFLQSVPGAISIWSKIPKIPVRG